MSRPPEEKRLPAEDIEEDPEADRIAALRQRPLRTADEKIRQPCLGEGPAGERDGGEGHVSPFVKQSESPGCDDQEQNVHGQNAHMQRSGHQHRRKEREEHRLLRVGLKRLWGRLTKMEKDDGRDKKQSDQKYLMAVDRPDAPPDGSAG